MALKIELEAKIIRLQEAVDMLLGKPGELFYDDRLTIHNEARKIRKEIVDTFNIFLVWLLLVIIIVGNDKILARQDYPTCDNTGMGERTATVINPSKGTIFIQCKAVK